MAMGPNMTVREARASDAGELATSISAFRANLNERVRKNEVERLAAEAIATEKGKRRQVLLILLLVVGMFIIWTCVFIWYSDRQATVRRILNETHEGDEKQARLAAERLANAAVQQKAREIQRQKQIERELTARTKQRKQIENPIQLVRVTTGRYAPRLQSRSLRWHAAAPLSQGCSASCRAVPVPPGTAMRLAAGGERGL